MGKGLLHKITVARALGRELGHAIQVDKDQREAGHDLGRADDVRKVISELDENLSDSERDCLRSVVSSTARTTVLGFRLRKLL